MNRLAEDKVTQGSTQVNDFAYQYDKAGNRTQQTINGTTTSFTYNSANQLTSTSAGVTYTYDANGNLTGISTGNEALVYNAKNQTTSINNVPMTYTGVDQNQRCRLEVTPMSTPLWASAAMEPPSTPVTTGAIWSMSAWRPVPPTTSSTV